MELPSGGWEFRPTRYDQHKVENVDGISNAWAATNRFESQSVRLRIEVLMAAAPYEAETNLILANSGSVVVFTNRASALGVSSELAVAPDLLKFGSASLGSSATNGSESARAAWTKVERNFRPPLNLSGREGLGVWVHEDVQGEVLNLQLRWPEHAVHITPQRQLNRRSFPAY